MNGFYFAGQQRRPHAGARRPLNDCRDPNEIGAFHIIGLTGLLIEIRVPCDAVFFRPSAAPKGRVVGIRHGWKDRVHSLEKPLLRHQAERRQCARFEVIHAESIVHADNDALLSNECHRYQALRLILFAPLAIAGMGRTTRFPLRSILSWSLFLYLNSCRLQELRRLRLSRVWKLLQKIKSFPRFRPWRKSSIYLQASPNAGAIREARSFFAQRPVPARSTISIVISSAAICRVQKQEFINLARRTLPCGGCVMEITVMPWCRRAEESLP